MIRPARFDDLTPGEEHSFVLEDPVGVLVAENLDEVLPLLESVENASADGLWSVGFVAYEAAPAFDAALQTRDPLDRLPLAWFGLFRTRTPVGSPTPSRGGRTYQMSSWRPDTEPDQYAAAIMRIRAEIERGITYQVNHTFRLRASAAGDLGSLYADLALAQRGGFSVDIDTGSARILSASPELFFRKRGTRVEMRPMKGTIRRGRWLAEDERRVAALESSAKDRAENLMIVDLLRNDLGRIARFGSVSVPRLFTPERYETLWQLTSLVEAEVPAETGVGAVFKALFPSGSVTGAPKASTMAIIADLETSPRGVYCGAVGYVAPRDIDDIQFNVAIRTVVIDTATGIATYGTGGGITWDSTSESEYDEAILKARVLTEVPDPYDLVETMRLEDGEYLFESRHLDRLAASAHYLGFPWEPDEIRSVMHEHAVAATSPIATKVRLTLSRGGAIELSSVETLTAPFVDDPGRATGEPLSVAIGEATVNPSERRLYHKTTARSIYREAIAAARGADDVVLVNTNREVTESTVANVAALIGAEWCTPPVDSGCLPGVYRAVLLERGAIIERPLSTDDFVAADEIALFNSVRGWRRAVIADDRAALP